MIITFELINPFELQKTAYFRVIGSKLNTYEVRIKIEDGEAIYEANDCTCKFGSFYSQTKKNRELNKCCDHITECLNFLRRECWIE